MAVDRSISRDEARDLAVTALLLAWMSYLVAGLVQASAVSVGSARLQLQQALKYFDPISSGMVLAAALLVVLAPAGAMEPAVRVRVRLAAVITVVGGLVQAVNLLTLSNGIATVEARLWPVLDNGVPAALLAGAAAVMVRAHDPLR